MDKIENILKRVGFKFHSHNIVKSLSVVAWVKEYPKFTLAIYKTWANKYEAYFEINDVNITIPYITIDWIIEFDRKETGFNANEYKAWCGHVVYNYYESPFLMDFGVWYTYGNAEDWFKKLYDKYKSTKEASEIIERAFKLYIKSYDRPEPPIF
jgi:hypothetical protein